MTFSKNKKKMVKQTEVIFFLRKNLNYSNIFQIYDENFSHELLARYLVRYGKIKRMFKYLHSFWVKNERFKTKCVVLFCGCKDIRIDIWWDGVCLWHQKHIFFCEKFVKMGVILLYQQHHLKFPVPVSQFYGCTKPFVYGV